MSTTVRPARPAQKKQNNGKKIALYATIALVVVLLGVVAFLSSPANPLIPKAATTVNQKASIAVGSTAPNFTVSSTAGPFTLDDVRTPVLLEIFATWCPHCQHETVVMNQLANEYRGKVDVIAVSGSPYAIDGSTAGSQEDVQLFGQHFDVTYPLAYDPTLDVANKYIQGGFPTIVLIDANKKIRWLADGEIPIGDVQKQINALPSLTKT
jgi:thiol-disulfide isomerase/thioredoxin